MKISERARQKWRSILPQLGIGPKHLDGKHGPCPACGGKDRFRFDDKEGAGSFYCNGCGAGDGFRLLMLVNDWTFSQAAARVEAIVGDAPRNPAPQSSSGDPADACRRLWSTSRRAVPDDEVGRYLAHRRLWLPDTSDIRIVSRCRVTGHPTADHLTAMVAMVRAPCGAPVTIHRTYLEGGGKAAMEAPRKLMPGPVPKGSAIRLAAASDTLAVAEGIETALAVMRDYALPCWAALNAEMLATFEWPEGVRRLEIFGDNDPGFGGQAGAYALARRARRGRDPLDVEVRIPAKVGEDWLDVGNAFSGHRGELLA